MLGRCEQASGETVMRYSDVTHWASPFYHQGRDACSNGFSQQHCPYDRRTLRGRAWIQGWKDRNGELIKEKPNAV